MIEREELDVDDIMALLMLVWYDLHPVYGNTSNRGRGIGGQAMSQQCSVVSPEGWEDSAVLYIETMINEYAQQHPDFIANVKRNELLTNFKEMTTPKKENE